MQSQGWIIVGVVVLPIVVVLIGMLVTYYNLKKTGQIWQEFAVREHLLYQSPRRIEGLYRGRQIVIRATSKLRLWTARKTVIDWTRFGLHVNNRSNAWLVITNDDDLSQVGQLLGIPATESPDKEINWRYTMRGQPKAILNDMPRLNAKLDQINSIFAISLKDNNLWLDHGELIVEREYLLFLLDLLSDLARMIEAVESSKAEVVSGTA